MAKRRKGRQAVSAGTPANEPAREDLIATFTRTADSSGRLTEAPRQPAGRASFSRTILTDWPALVAIALFLILAFVQILAIKAHESGKFIYPIDDVYMHLAVARNLVTHGLWGVSSYNGFCNCISSLIWPVINAVCIALFGMHEYYPLVLNLIVASGAILYAGSILRRTVGVGLGSVVILCGAVFLTPLVPVALLGMEHSLQILASLLFVDLAARLLTRDEHALRGTRAETALCAAAVLLVVTRYEGLFQVAAVGLLLLCQRRWRLAVLLGVCAGAPLVVFGLFAKANGWAFFPTSLLLKGNANPVLSWAGLQQYFSKGYDLLLQERHFFMMVVALAVTLAANLQRRWTLWSYSTLLLAITFLITVQHLQFASLGWFYRYEAYLMVLIILGIGVAIMETLPGRTGDYWLRGPGLVHAGALAVVALLLGSPVWQRAAYALPHTAKASYNIYEQQHQMGRFVRQFYQGRSVMANDIGELTWMADIKLVDTAGLATLEVLRARRAEAYHHDLLRRLAKEHGTELVMIYDTWAEGYGGALPEWVPVGRWTIRNNVVTGGDTVSFYAANKDLVPRLTGELQEFARDLPKDVIQDGSYIGRTSYFEGSYLPETNEHTTLYWTKKQEDFVLYPVHGEAIDSDETTLTLSYLPMMPGQRIKITFNGETVSDESIAPGAERHWKSVTVKARWKPGGNHLLFVGYGDTFFAPHDSRELMFQILDPLQGLNAEGKVIRPGVPEGLP